MSSFTESSTRHGRSSGDCSIFCDTALISTSSESSVRAILHPAPSVSDTDLEGTGKLSTPITDSDTGSFFGSPGMPQGYRYI